MPDLQTILSGLSEAQRNAIFWLGEDWTDDRHSDALVPVLWSDDALFLQPAIIEYRKRIERGWRPVHEHRLTHLGIQVRAALQGEQR